MVASFSNFVLTFENAFYQRFHFKANRKAYIILKSDTKDFQNSPPYERSACFYVTISESFKSFKRFHINFNSNLLGNKNLFQKTGLPFFWLKPLRLKSHHFHSKLFCQKPMLGYFQDVVSSSKPRNSNCNRKWPNIMHCKIISC